ncbi:MAG TPA: hypothetical protein VM575_10875 [Nocardioides sp.]|nr:hypothetical protein [Nocardioides sp.]
MRTIAAACVAGLMVLLAACGSDDPSEPGAEASSTGLPRSDEPVILDPARFTAEVTNPWFPLEPGTRWTYRETTEDGEELRVVVTATPLTQPIANGVTARVVRDTVTLDGEVVEDTLDWYAQDDEGTVWYLGEDTAEFEDGEVTSREGSFEAGVDGAEAGVIMPASPEVGLAYRQEHYAGQAEDRGEVLAVGQTAQVPAGQYDDLLQTADTTPLEPDVLEHKYYARGVGLVLTIDKEAGGREELLSATRIGEARARRAGEAPLGEAY